MTLPTLRPFLLAGFCCMAAPGAIACDTAPVDPLQRTCHVTYAGETQRVAICPTQHPYLVESVSIGGRFRFKAVHVQAEHMSPHISLYVYWETPQQPQLIQQVVLRPPYPAPPAGGSVELLGEQHVYAGPLERELIYRCAITQDAP
jgi:hypothetical protein